MQLSQLFGKKYGVGTLVILIISAYGIYALNNYLNTKNGSFGTERLSSSINSVYQNNSSSSPQPAEPLGQNESYASVKGISSQSVALPSSCSPGKQNAIQNPSELLPKDTNNQWAKLNPSGKGALQDVAFLNAGYHIGVDTISGSLRNPNLQIRSEPPNPQKAVGPWNQSTITPDFMRPPLEIGGPSQ